MAEATITRSGVYCIRNVISGRRYVGSSVNVSKRWNAHRSQLRKGEHHASALQRSWLKHGEDAFEFTILELVPDLQQLVEREQFWMDDLGAFSKSGFNSAPTAGSCLGCRHTAETKAKQSAQRRGVAKSPEHRKAIGDAQKGKVISEAQRKTAAENTRRFFQENPAARERMREVGRRNGLLTKGRKMTAEYRAWMSAQRKADPKFAETARANARQVTPEGNRRSAEKRSLIMAGRPCHDRRALTFEQAEEVRRLKTEGWTYARLAERYGLNRVTLFQIVKRRTYQRP